MQIALLSLFIILILGGYVLVRVLLRKKAIPLALRILLPIAEILLSIALAYWLMVYLYAPRPVILFLIGLHDVTLIDGLSSLISLLVGAIRRKKVHFLLLPILSCVLSLGHASYGVANMEIVGEHHIEHTSEKILHPHTFAFLTDIHVGSSQPFSVTEKTIASIASKDLDFLLIGGDVVDCFTSREEMKKTFALFSSFPFPVYLTYGNHEVDDLGQNFTDEELRAEIKANDVHLLEDEFVPIGEDLLLLGRVDLAYKERKGYESLVNPSPSSFLLTLDHQPFDFESASSFGVDLQLSGHTHAGQLLPLGWLYRLATYSYGDYYRASSRLYVTPGASGWAAPLRTQGHSQYEIVHLNPKG